MVEIREPKHCSVKLSDVMSRGCRIDASAFDVDAMLARDKVLHGKYAAVPLGDMLSDAYVCGRFKRKWVDSSAYPIFQPSSMTDVKPTPDGYLSASTNADFDALRVHDGQVLMTCSGSIGRLGFVSKTLDGKIFSHDMLRVCAAHDYEAGYIYAYLSSDIGNKLVLTNNYGAVIQHVEPEHLKQVLIPDAPEDIKRRIDEIVRASYRLRDESNELFDEAEALLVETLGLPSISDLRCNLYKPDAGVDTFSVKLSDMDGRADASYHVPVVDAILDCLGLAPCEVTTVGDVRVSKDVVLPGRFKRVYVDEGYGTPFIGGKQLWELDPSNKKYLSNVHHGERIAGQLALRENMTLITCSGTIGKVAMVPKHWMGWAANQHIIRIVPANDDDIAGYLNVFLSSDYGRALICRNTYGSVVDEITDAQVKDIAFPLLDDKLIQEHINDLALAANAKRYEAYQLEQEALRIMNEEVLG